MKPLLIAVVVLLSHPAPAQFVLTKVADTNTAIPNGTGTFTGFSPLYGPSTSQGSTAFYATGSGNQKGYYIQTNGVLFRAVDTNTAAPGGGNFISFSSTAYGLEGDVLTFTGSTPSGNGIFTYSNGVITKLVETNSSLPNSTTTFGNAMLLHPYDERVVFYGVGANSQVGIYLYDAGVLSKVADTNDNYIGGTGKMGFTSSSADVALDADGAVAFLGYDAALTSRRSIFTSVSNSLSAAASTTTTVPGHATTFTDFARKPDLSGGKVVFIGGFSGGSGVYQANLDGSGLIAIAETTTQIPGTNFNFSSFQEVAIEHGTVVFTAQGPGIYGAYRYQNGVLDRIVAKPDTLGGKPIQTVVLGNKGLSGGRVALQITFADTSSSIYTTPVGFANQSPAGGTLVPDSLLYSASTGFSFQFTGEIGRAYRIQYNTNIASANWFTLTNFTYTQPLTISDNAATGSAARMYRAISP